MTKGEHTVSAVLGIVTALLFSLAGAISLDYFPSAAVAGLTALGVAVLGALAFIGAAGAYLVEEQR